MLTARFVYLPLVFAAYGQFGRIFLLTVQILFGLRSSFLTVEIGLVFFTYGCPRPEIAFGLLCLRFSTSRNWVWSVLISVPHRKQKQRTARKRTSIVSKRAASLNFES